MSENKTYSRQFKIDATLKVFMEMMQGEAVTYPWTNEELDDFSRWTGVSKKELKNKTAEELERLAPFVMSVVARSASLFVPFELTALEGFEPISATAYVNGEPVGITTSGGNVLKLEVNGLEVGEEVEIAIPAGYQLLDYEQNKVLREYYSCKELKLMSRAVLHGVSYPIYNAGSSGLVYNTVIEVSPKLLKYIDRGDDRVRLSNLFNGCGRLKAIPEGLFAGFCNCVTDMFKDTFISCTSITAIPASLFSDIHGSASSMFQGTFSNCASLTAIPEGLFAGVKGCASWLFHSTFESCYSLTAIPEGLFASIEGNAPAMFSKVFCLCKSLQRLPNDLFAGVSGSAAQMFTSSFAHCYSLQTIPDSLFARVSGGADWLFTATFINCNSLTAIPSVLFAGIDGAQEMFKETFSGCGELSGETPIVRGGKMWKNFKGGGECFKGCTKLADYKEIPDDWK